MHMILTNDKNGEPTSWDTRSIDDTLDMLVEFTIFPWFDLFREYWQVELAEENKEKTVITLGSVLWQFWVITIWLMQGSCRLRVFDGKPFGMLVVEYLLCYLVSCSFSWPHWCFGEVLQRLRGAKLTVNLLQAICPKIFWHCQNFNEDYRREENILNVSWWCYQLYQYWVIPT